jgi:hypothetical protein
LVEEKRSVPALPRAHKITLIWYWNSASAVSEIYA